MGWGTRVSEVGCWEVLFAAAKVEFVRLLPDLLGRQLLTLAHLLKSSGFFLKLFFF